MSCGLGKTRRGASGSGWGTDQPPTPRGGGASRSSLPSSFPPAALPAAVASAAWVACFVWLLWRFVQGDEDGWSPLWYAAYFGRIEAVELLIAAGSDLNQVIPSGGGGRAVVWRVAGR